jgi:acetyl/propionyl-CoA carboxylase alpha subunit
MKKIRKILIANRGEIVNRIIRAARELSIIPVVVYTDEDQGLTYLDTLIEKHRLEGSTLLETYLNQEQIIGIARQAGVDAIHPGYGFLSENPEFAELCAASGIIWIGPSPAVMRQMSGKAPARELAIKTGVPVIPAISGNAAEIISQSSQLRFPILIKAVAGGGGRGMRIIKTHEDFPRQIELASAEAGKFFGNPGIFAEQYIENGRHIEVQIIGDHHGNVIHLFERDCSVQRRYQKIIEEAPAPNLPETTRNGLLESAVKLARAAGYDSAGTIEFLVDPEGNHYFIEMNTRIQVEHPVTEMITGIDIVKEQIRVAEGKPLKFAQDRIRTRGHAIECRICAEDYNDHFHPSPGTIGLYVAPEGRGIRIEDAVRNGSEISSRFDSMISKLIVRAPSRESAIERMRKALDHYVIHGPETNVAFQREMMSDPAFVEGKYTTQFIGDFTEHVVERIRERRNRVSREHLGHLYQQASYRLHRRSVKVTQKDPWNGLHGWRQLSQRPLDIEGYTVWINGRDPVGVIDHTPGKLRFILDSHEQTAWYSVLPDNTMILSWQGFNFRVTDPAVTRKLGTEGGPESGNGKGNGSKITAPLPGRIARLLVKTGEQVTRGTCLAVIESMKTENQILAPSDGIAGEIMVKEGQQVKSNDLIMDLNTN